jgi:hypothetical protein
MPGGYLELCIHARVFGADFAPSVWETGSARKGGLAIADDVAGAAALSWRASLAPGFDIDLQSGACALALWHRRRPRRV